MNEQRFTPGPWDFKHRKTAESGYSMYATEVFCAKGATIATFSWYLMPTVNGVTGTYREGNARLCAAAPDLLAEVEREYINLADIHNEWPGRNKPEGQMKLGRLRDLICKATGREPQDVQDDYGNRAAIARALPQGAP